MNRTGRYFTILAIFIFLLSGCSVFRKTGKTKKQSLEPTVWLKKVDLYSCNKSKKLGKIDIRYAEDSVLVIIVRNNTGIEGGRIYIYKDTLYAFNRINKKYFRGPLNELTGDQGKNSDDLKRLGEILYNHGYNSGQLSYSSKKLKTNVEIYVKKFRKINNEYYIPEKLKTVIRVKKSAYCIYSECDINNITSNQNIPVGMINYKGRYTRKKSINEIMR